MSQSNTCTYRKNEAEDCQKKQHTNKISIAICNKALLKKESKYEVKNFTYHRDISYLTLASKLREGRSIAFNFTYRDNKFHADKKHFRESEFICIDIDNDKDEKITIGAIQTSSDDNPKYIRENACLIYTSENHRKNGNGDRYKVLFHLPYTVENWGTLGEILNAFKKKFPESDKGNILNGRYIGGGRNTQVIIFGNRLTEEALMSLLEENQETNMTKPIFKNEITNLKKYTQSVYDDELTKLSLAKIHQRNTTLNDVAFNIGKHLKYLDITENQALSDIISTALNIVADKSFTKEDIERTAQSGLSAGMKNTKELTEREGTYINDKYDTDFEITPNTNRQRKLFANKPKDNHFQVLKPVLDMYPKAKQEANGYIGSTLPEKNIEFQHFTVISRDNNTLSISYILDVLRALKNPNVIKSYFAVCSYASKYSRVDKPNNRIVLEDVDLNNIVEILNPGKKLSKQHRLRKREEVKSHIKMLGSVLFFNESRNKDKNMGVNISRYDLTGNFSIKNNRLTCYLPFQLKNIGSYIPESIFKLNANEKTALALIIEFYRRANQKYISSKTNGFLPPTFKEVIISRDDAVKISGLELSNRKNVTETNKSLKNALKKLNHIGFGIGYLISSKVKGDYIKFKFKQKNILSKQLS